MSNSQAASLPKISEFADSRFWSQTSCNCQTASHKLPVWKVGLPLSKAKLMHVWDGLSAFQNSMQKSVLHVCHSHAPDSSRLRQNLKIRIPRIFTKTVGREMSSELAMLVSACLSERRHCCWTEWRHWFWLLVFSSFLPASSFDEHSSENSFTNLVLSTVVLSRYELSTHVWNLNQCLFLLQTNLASRSGSSCIFPFLLPSSFLLSVTLIAIPNCQSLNLQPLQAPSFHKKTVTLLPLIAKWCKTWDLPRTWDLLSLETSSKWQWQRQRRNMIGLEKVCKACAQPIQAVCVDGDVLHCIKDTEWFQKLLKDDSEIKWWLLPLQTELLGKLDAATDVEQFKRKGGTRQQTSVMSWQTLIRWWLIPFLL